MPQRPAAEDTTRLLDPIANWYVADVLSGVAPPKNGKHGVIAYKTGTSYGFRDAWAAGFDGRTTIAVWIGRADGAPVPGMTGVLAAAPVLFDAFNRVSTQRVPLRPAPVDAVALSSGNLPPPLKVFVSDRSLAVAAAFEETPVAIAFPPDNSELAAEQQGDALRPILVRAEGGALPLTFLIDDVPIETAPHKREAFVPLPGRGFVKLSVIDAKGNVDRVTVKVD